MNKEEQKAYEILKPFITQKWFEENKNARYFSFDLGTRNKIHGSLYKYNCPKEVYGKYTGYLHNGRTELMNEKDEDVVSIAKRMRSCFLSLDNLIASEVRAK